MATTISKIGIKNSTGSGYDTRDIGAKGQNIEIGYDSSGNIIEDVDKTTAATTKTLSTVLKTNATTVSNLNTTLSKKISDLDSSKAPSSHITAQADASTLGHIKIGTGLSVDGDAASSTYGQTRVNFASNGETAANKAVQANDTRLSNSRSNPNAVTFTTNAGDSAGSYNGSAAKTVGYSTVGAAPAGHTSTQATSSILGHVTAGTGLSASSGKLSVSYGTSAGTACVGNDGRLSDSRTPKSHAASTASTYGAGNASQFGHVKLTDEYNVTEPSAATNGAATSIAASAYALQQAYSTLNSNLSNIKVQSNNQLHFMPFTTVIKYNNSTESSITTINNMKELFGSGCTINNSGAFILNGDNSGASSIPFSAEWYRNTYLVARAHSTLNINVRITGVLFYAEGVIDPPR